MWDLSATSLSALSNNRYLRKEKDYRKRTFLPITACSNLNYLVHHQHRSNSSSWQLQNTSQNPLEVEVDDDIVEKLAILKALQVFGCHGDASLGGGRWVLDQSGGKCTSSGHKSGFNNAILFANRDVSIMSYKFNLDLHGNLKSVESSMSVVWKPLSQKVGKHQRWCSNCWAYG